MTRLLLAGLLALLVMSAVALTSGGRIADQAAKLEARAHAAASASRAWKAGPASGFPAGASHGAPARPGGGGA